MPIQPAVPAVPVVAFIAPMTSATNADVGRATRFVSNMTNTNVTDAELGAWERYKIECAEEASPVAPTWFVNAFAPEGVGTIAINDAFAPGGAGTAAINAAINAAFAPGGAGTAAINASINAAFAPGRVGTVAVNGIINAALNNNMRVSRAMDKNGQAFRDVDALVDFPNPAGVLAATVGVPFPFTRAALRIFTSQQCAAYLQHHGQVVPNGPVSQRREAVREFIGAPPF